MNHYITETDYSLKIMNHYITETDYSLKIMNHYITETDYIRNCLKIMNHMSKLCLLSKETISILLL